MVQTKYYLGLDVGERRIGVASADAAVRIAVPLEAVPVDGNEIKRLSALAHRHTITAFVVGYPRNQSGEATAQTTFVETFAKRLEAIAPVLYQDESLTSVEATRRLNASGKAYTKGDIDTQAAAIILQDFLELHT